jgi:hypothetical protein
MLALYLLKKMKLELIQYSHNAINSIYIYKDFLENKDQLLFYKNKIKEHTRSDQMNRDTNVKATMTDWWTLLKDKDFDFLHSKLLHTIHNTIFLRSPGKLRGYKIHNSWGMKHCQGDGTICHIHECLFAGVFYLDVPCTTMIRFEDFNMEYPLEDNLFMFFPGYTKHAVSTHTSESPRLSMAFNVIAERDK